MSDFTRELRVLTDEEIDEIAADIKRDLDHPHHLDYEAVVIANLIYTIRHERKT